MKRNHLGLCDARLTASGGVFAEVPFLIAGQGVVVSADWAEVTLAVLPIAGSEDPKFGHLLGRSGIYRIEDNSGTIARVGQGRLLDRVRRHRAAPVVLAWRLVAVVRTNGGWTFEERCYLEARWAEYWRRRGHALAATTFMTRFSLNEHDRSLLDVTLAQIIKLEAFAKRLFDGDLLDEFQCAPGEDADVLKGLFQHFRTYPPGVVLEFQGGGVDATARVLRRSVVLEANSTVSLSLGRSVGAVFGAQHQYFLAATGTVQLTDGLGRTTRTFECATAAAAIKRATGGRVHNADRWRIMRPGAAHGWGD